jgi:ribosomal protein S18 acetylase RimI-like enzyme
MHTVQANIENLTSLWKTAAIPFDAYFKDPLFHYCDVTDSDWPNRIWFDQDITANSLETALKSIPDRPNKLHLPYWDLYNSKSYELIEAKGYPLRSEQAGMSLQLQEPFALKNNLQFSAVTTEADAITWVTLFQQAFNYKINHRILMSTWNKVQYFLAHYENQPAGTAVLYITGNIAGIHAVGVIPDMRRKGFADEIMKFILNRSIELKAAYATLQASKMGKDLYLKLGFKDEFLIKNYQLRIK